MRYPTEESKKLAQLLRWRRETMQISMGKLAARIEISASYMSTLELGWLKPSVEVAVRWLKELEVDGDTRTTCVAYWSIETREEYAKWEELSR